MRMCLLNRFLILVIGMCVSGCAVKSSAVKSLPTSIQRNQIQKAKKIEEPNTKQEENKTSLVFLKTDFQGVLKTNYIKLTIISKSDPNKRVNINLGEKVEAILSNQEESHQYPGYVYFELPKGDYQISTISVLAGTTSVTEALNLDFSVILEKNNYLGTLVINGTKEKIKLGGVPFIKPSFDYQLHILDERAEAEQNFKQKYPQNKLPIHVGLLSHSKNDQT